MNGRLPQGRWLVTPFAACRAIIFVMVINYIWTMNQPDVQAAPVQQIDSQLEILTNKAEAQGSVRLIVQLAASSELQGIPSSTNQRQAIESAQQLVIEKMSETTMEAVTEFDYIPFMTVKVNADAIEQLAALPEVISFEEDVPIATTLASTIPLIGADVAWANSYTGAGQTVAILDTGVDLTHPAFTTGGNRIVAEGCYSTTDSAYSAVSVCPGGVSASTAAGSGDDCLAAAAGYPSAQLNCTHGTHVAGIAAGNDGATFGVAKDANIIAVQIFSLFTTAASCGGADSCMLTFSSDQIAGLERVYALRESHNIAAINMSLGGNGSNPTACDSDSRKAVIDKLRSAGIITVIASGNNGFKTGLSKPACISSAISVGASDDEDNVASFSNVAPILDLIAPGVGIYAAVPNGSYGAKSGTSMATPHVTGAFALYRQAVPNAAVSDLLAVFQTTGTLIDDNRSDGVEIDIPRINVDQAINSYVPGLTVEITSSHQYAFPGDMMTYTLTISNQTAVHAASVEVSSLISEHFIPLVSTLSDDALVISEQAGDKIAWLTGQSLAPNQSLTRTFSGVIDPNLLAGGDVVISTSAVSSSMTEGRTATAVTIINQIAPCTFSDSFENGSLSSHWSVVTTEDGRVAINNALPHTGSNSLVLDDMSAGGTYSEAGAILNVDLTGQTAVELRFDWYDLADEYDPNYDGVFIRETPNSSWVKVYHFDGTNSESYQNATIDLRQAASNAGLALTKNFQIKFNFYDNYPALFSNINGGDGYAIDNVSLSCEPVGLTLNNQLNNLSLVPGELNTYTLVLANNDATIATNAIISSTIPTGFTLAGPVTIIGSSGDVAENEDDLPIIAENVTVPANGQVTLSIPFWVDIGIEGGSLFELDFSVKSDQYPEWMTHTDKFLILNGSPAAQNDVVTTTINTPITIYPLVNDVDPNGDTLTITNVSKPDQNGVVWATGESILYTPQATFGGVETFAYTVSDTAGKTAVSQVTVTVPNVAPTANDDETQAPPTLPVIFPATHNDTDPNLDDLTIVSIDSVSNGTAIIVDNLILFTPLDGFKGTAVVDYTIADGNGGTDSAQLEITLGAGLNGSPIAVSDAISIERDEWVQLELLENDLDPNSDPISLSAVTSPQFGTAVIINDKIEYTPMAGFVGIDTFDYTIQDDKGAVATTAVVISIALENTEIFNVDPHATQVQSFTTADSHITLEIPVGALPPTASQIAYTVFTDAEQRGVNQDLGIYFALNLGEGGQIFMNSPTFSPALEITIHYDPAQFPQAVSETELQIFFFNETKSTWEQIEVIEHDMVNNSVTASLTHFTDFRLGSGFSVYLPIVLK